MGGGGVKLLNKIGHDLRWLFRASALQYKALSSNQLTATYKETLDIGLVFITGKGDNILLAFNRGGDSLPFNNPVYSLDLVSKLRSLF